MVSLKDNSGYLWISTNKGISRFNPKDSTAWTFDYRDGLQSNEFNSGVCFNKNGKMYFGGINGYNSFYPDSIQKSDFIPPIVFTDFLIDNKSVSIGGDSPLKKHISYTNTINLGYSQSNIAFEIAALDYYIPEKNQYKYWLVHHDKSWVEIGNRRFINFTNLSPGKYELKVMGSNHDGVWIEKEKAISIEIIIKPPWYQTCIAYIFYFLLFCLVMWLLWRFQINN